MADFRALILQRHRHLKWKVFDKAEAVLLIWFGWKNALLDLGSYRMPSLIPLTVYTAIVPAAGVLIALFTIEQLVNGWRHGFEGPEDRDELPQAIVEEIE